MADKNMFTEKKKKTPKTKEVFVVQGNYGSAYEDVTEETSYFAAKNRLKEYRDNEPQYGHRMITRRVPYFELSKQDKINNANEREVYLNRVLSKRSK